LNHEGINIKRLTKDDLVFFQNLIRLFNEVFEVKTTEIASNPQLEKLLKQDSFVALAAISDGEVIGGITAYEMQMYSGDCSEIYIYDMAVKTTSQHMGIGKKLINSLKEHCLSHNIINIFVEAHEVDKHAVNFYTSAGGIPEKVVHFNFNSGGIAV